MHKKLIQKFLYLEICEGGESQGIGVCLHASLKCGLRGSMCVHDRSTDQSSLEFPGETLTLVENQHVVTAGGCETLLISIIFCSLMHSFSYTCLSLSKMIEKHQDALLH